METKKTYINKLIKLKKELFESFNFNEKDLIKGTLKDLKGMFEAWEKLKVVEIVDTETANTLIPNSCYICLEYLERARKENKKVLLSCDKKDENHIVGIC